MRKIIQSFIILLLAFVSTEAFSQKNDCTKFKDGKFLYTAKGTDDYIIIRKGTLQKEKLATEKTYSTFYVTWINDCTYELTMTKKTAKKNPDLPSDTKITVTITSTTADSYTQNTTSNLSTFVLTGTMTRIK